ncbi:Hsp33 family molecular chaperone HslO [Hyalangium rubrum]|uniref:Hsp33 family molecular chaperone HslO n=1 Tax=Hyalangium rubrum TaxID=3103134 RepID=A0ABU5H1X1_9BACT|nr:Hsp33 family molecular chaperone HslO [Hyalangium sp. s54d21]MDY7226904.1 Hsp33 family molecular chaperone HslO [Hyalangium sp. s54d21]
MADELVSGLLKDVDVRVVLALTSELSRKARDTHQSQAASAALLSQGLTAAALMGALQKGPARINVQLECDGPLRGFFVDGDNAGVVRGYTKNPHVKHVGAEGQWHWRPVLGNKGYISVLRDIGEGEHYRSSVELERFDFVEDLERYFAISDQVATQLTLEQFPLTGNGTTEPLGLVAGVLLQPLPNGDREAFQALGRQIKQGFPQALRAHGAEGGAAILKALLPERTDLEIMSRYPLSFACTCSRERVKTALLAMGREELTDMLQKEGKAEVTCQFCTTQYVIPGEEIRALLQAGTS